MHKCKYMYIYIYICVCGNTAYRAIEPLKITAREIPSPRQPYSIVGKKQYYGSQWCPRTALFPSFFRISSFVFRTNTFIQVWIYLRMSKWWQDFHFWVHCPFKWMLGELMGKNIWCVTLYDWCITVGRLSH